MSKRVRFKPSLRSICVIGTIAHNKAFTAREVTEYLGFDFGRGRVSPVNGADVTRWLKKHGHIRPGDRKGTWYPTAKGWRMIEKACRR